jgi:hypothetical protein
MPPLIMVPQTPVKHLHIGGQSSCPTQGLDFLSWNIRARPPAVQAVSTWIDERRAGRLIFPFEKSVASHSSRTISSHSSADASVASKLLILSVSSFSTNFANQRAWDCMHDGPFLFRIRTMMDGSRNILTKRSTEPVARTSRTCWGTSALRYRSMSSRRLPNAA